MSHRDFSPVKKFVPLEWEKEVEREEVEVGRHLGPEGRSEREVSEGRAEVAEKERRSGPAEREEREEPWRRPPMGVVMLYCHSTRRDAELSFLDATLR